MSPPAPSGRWVGRCPSAVTQGGLWPHPELGGRATRVRCSSSRVTLGCLLLRPGPQDRLPSTAAAPRLALTLRAPNLTFGLPSGPQVSSYSSGDCHQPHRAAWGSGNPKEKKKRERENTRACYCLRTFPPLRAQAELCRASVSPHRGKGTSAAAPPRGPRLTVVGLPTRPGC